MHYTISRQILDQAEAPKKYPLRFLWTWEFVWTKELWDGVNIDQDQLPGFRGSSLRAEMRKFLLKNCSKSPIKLRDVL